MEIYIIAILSGVIIAQQITHARERRSFIKALLSRNVNEYTQATEKPPESKNAHNQGLIRRNMMKHYKGIVSRYQQID